MSTMSLRIPDSYHARLRELAKREHVSINQLITSALAEKLSALDTEAYLQARAKKASRKRFDEALEHVPDIAPEKGDEL
jgi:hypothetical protein